MCMQPGTGNKLPPGPPQIPMRALRHHTYTRVRVRDSGWAWICMPGFDWFTSLGFQNKAHGGEKLYSGKKCGPGKPETCPWLSLAE